MNDNKSVGKRNAHLRTQLTRWGRLLFKTLAVMATLTILASLAGVVATAHTPTLEWTDISYPRFDPPGPPRSVTDLAATPDGRVYVVSGGRVFRLGDDDVWQLFNTGISHHVNTVLVNPLDGQLYAGTDSGGVFCLADDVQTWQAVGEGLIDFAVQALVVDAQGKLYAGTGNILGIGDIGGSGGSDDSGGSGGDIGGVFHLAEGEQIWRTVNDGLTDLNVHALAMNVGSDLYAGTYGGGVFRLSNDEQTWQAIGGGTFGSVASTLAVDARSNIYVGTYGGGVFRLADDEQTWQDVNEGLSNLYIQTLVVNTRGDLYAGTYGGGVFRLADVNEQTWQTVNTGLPDRDVHALAVNARGQFYAGTRDGGVFRLADDEQTWQAINEGLPNLCAQALVVDAGGDLYAGTPGDGVFHLTDNQQTWQAINEGLSNLYVQTLVADAGGDLYAGTRDGGVFRLADGEHAWQDINEGLSSLAVLALMVNERDELYAVTFDGVFRLADDEKTWQVNVEGLSHNVRAPAVDAGGKLYAGTWGSGVFRLLADDGERTWQAINEGLSDLYVHTLAVDAGGDLYAWTPDGVFYLADDEQTWQAINEGLTSLDIQALVVDARGDLYAGTQDGVFRLTDDRGRTWQAINEGLTSLYIQALAVDAEGDLYAGTSYGGVFRLADDTQTWQDVNEGLTNLYVLALTVDAKEDLYAGTSYGGVFRLADDAQTWQDANEGLTTPYVLALAADARGDIYAGTTGGVFHLTNGNTQTWQNINEGLDSLYVQALVVDAGGDLYAGTYGGVFRLANDEQSWQAVNEGLTALDVQALATSAEGILYARIWRWEQNIEGETSIDTPEIHALGTNNIWKPRLLVGWTPDQVPYDLGNTDDGGFLWGRIDRRLWFSRDGKVWLPLIELSNAPQFIEVQSNRVHFRAFAGAGMLLQGTIDLPLIWRMPAPYLTLVAVGWTVVGWVGANLLSTVLMVSLPTLLVVLVLTFNTMRVSSTPFPVALRLVLSRQAGNVSLDARWPTWEGALRDALRRRGLVDGRAPLDIPAPLRRQAFAHYYDLHGEQEELVLRNDVLHLSTGGRTWAWLDGWEPAAIALAETGALPEAGSGQDGSPVESLVEPLAQALGWQRIGARSLNKLHAVVVAAPALRLRIPGRFALVFVEPTAIRAGIEDDLVDLNQVLDLGEFFTLVIPFEAPDGGETNARQLKTLLRASPYAHDLIVLSHEDVLGMLAAREPAARLIECILEQVDLTVVSPFVTSGPVPERMFFGRDQEIKTITQALPRADFALVGNRKIGKTSLLQRIERVLSSSDDCAPVALNFQAVRDDETLFETLAQETGFVAGELVSRAFADFVTYLRQQHPGRTPVLLIDEVDELLSFDARRSYALGGVWRALAFGRMCRFVFVGSRVLAQALRDPNSPFFNFPQEIRVGFLPPDKARAVVTGPMDDLGIALEPRQALLDGIMELCSCHPNLVQFVCAQMVERASERGERRVLLADLEETAASGAFSDYYMNTLWGQAEPLERAISILGDADGFTMPEVEAALSEADFDAARHQVKGALDMLAVYSVLTRKGRRYSFAPASLPRILRETQEIDFLLEEAQRLWREGK